jgi:hypothetical protein
MVIFDTRFLCQRLGGGKGAITRRFISNLALRFGSSFPATSDTDLLVADIRKYFAKIDQK